MHSRGTKKYSNPQLCLCEHRRLANMCTSDRSLHNVRKVCLRIFLLTSVRNGEYRILTFLVWEMLDSQISVDMVKDWFDNA